jgi:23S rRNA G2069 N7-methylase RlmK/C1962 C5-methylase RlmI
LGSPRAKIPLRVVCHSVEPVTESYFEQAIRRAVELRREVFRLDETTDASCSGLLSLEDFEAHVIKAAHKQNRRLQFFERTSPGPDHPVYSNCLEGRYLKLLWARVV